ncbi:MAG: trypsin-like peptidase domain-containing protein, partial [Negativicutes bacterium]
MGWFYHNWKKKMGALTAAFAVGAVLLSGCTDSRANTANDAGGSSIPVASTAVSRNLSAARNTPVVRAAEAVGPAVVGITNKTLVRDWFNNPIQQEGFGSGVIFRKDGYIVTNNHVIDGAREILVSLADGRTLKGKVVGV